jgi:hypothetical protein
VIAFLFVLGLATIVTIPAVLFIPRQHQSPLFDRVLWGATWALAILGAYIAPSYIASDPPWNAFMIAQMPVIPTVIGAVAGAFSINVLLWLMDRFSSPSTEDEPLANGDVGDPSANESDELPH